jgi:hypothetical protein
VSAAAGTVRRRAAFKLTRPEPLEDDLHASVARALDLLLLEPAMWTTIPIGHVKLTGAQAAKLARVGVKRGWMDILVLHPGRPIGLELKRPGSRLSRSRIVPTRKGGRRMVEGQTDVFPRLEASGLRIFVCSSVEDVLAALKSEGVPMRPHRVPL